MNRRLTLTSERLTELTTDELAGVVAGRDMITNPCPLPTHTLTTITTGLRD